MTNGTQKPINIDIQAADPGALQWKGDQAQVSLGRLLDYVEGEADKAIRWYWSNKKWKARLSRWVRLWTLILTALAGLVPIAFYIGKEFGWFGDGVATTSGLWASALVGVAASLLGLDRAFGFSTGWARYVLAATEIRKRLEEFRMDWIALTATSGSSPNAEQINAFIQKAKEFRIAVENVVAQETKDWLTEFQSNMAQLEKDVRAQFDALKAQVEKSQETREAATQPGSIEATIENADKTKDFACFVTLRGPDGVLAGNEPITGSRTWTRINVKPGQYQLSVAATRLDGTPASASCVVLVKSSEVAKASVTLPLI